MFAFTLLTNVMSALRKVLHARMEYINEITGIKFFSYITWLFFSLYYHTESLLRLYYVLLVCIVYLCTMTYEIITYCSDANGHTVLTGLPPRGPLVCMVFYSVWWYPHSNVPLVEEGLFWSWGLALNSSLHHKLAKTNSNILILNKGDMGNTLHSVYVI